MEMAASFPEPMESVEFTVAKEVTWQPTISVKAEAVAIQSVNIRNELDGRIVEVNFQPGDTVKAGQVLIRLDTSEERARLAAARAQTRLAELDYQRNQQLVEKRVISESERDRTFAERDASAAAEAQLEAIIEKMSIRAPFDAIAGLHELEVGQYLEGGTIITRLVGLNDEIWIDFSLPQHQAQLQVGDSIDLSTRQLKNVPPNARIIARDAWVDTQSRNIRYRAIADIKGFNLYPGSAISVNAPLSETTTAISIPVTAVRYDTHGTIVFVLVPDDGDERAAYRARQRSISLGLENNQNVYVLDGLNPGEIIATFGSFKLREGILVNAKGSSSDITVSTLN
jgi:membrane fusion protein (multidrug efflux system)